MNIRECPKCKSQSTFCLNYSETFLFEEWMCEHCSCTYKVEYELKPTKIEIVDNK